MNQILTPEEVTSIRKDALASRSSTLSYNLQIVEDLCDTIEALRARLHEVDAEAERLTDVIAAMVPLVDQFAKVGCQCDPEESAPCLNCRARAAIGKCWALRGEG